MQTITFYSYKGGTGRSLLLANAARYLALLGKRVVAVDFDFEAPGLHYKLGGAHSSSRADDVPPERGVVDYLLATAQSDRRPPKVVTFLRSVPVPRGTTGKLFLMPAGSAPSGAYWKSLTTLLRGDFLSGPEGSGVAACLELKARVEDELRADFMLIDSRTGITELGGLVTSLLADTVISLVLDNRESLAGSRAVMRSFGRAERLGKQTPIEQFAVLSRVPDVDDNALKRILRFLNEPGPSAAETLSLDRLFVLRVDPDLAVAEKLHVGSSESKAGSVLYKDYIALFEAIVTADPELVTAATRRHEVVAAMREWLTERSDSGRHRRETPAPWDQEQIEEGVQFGDREKRYADLVVYGESGHKEALMAVEYMDDLKSSDAWKWWEKNTKLRCVVLIGKTPNTYLDLRVFTRARRAQKFTERDDFSGWLVKWPISFSSLDDPGDRSVASMLRAIQRGEDGFIGLVVREWQHASFVTLHGGVPYKPHLARQIVDGLAQVSDHETALRVLWRTAPDPFERSDEGFGPGGGGMEEITTRELHAPLWWRLSVQAKVEAFGGRGRHREANFSAGLDLLTRDLMGLSLDQDRDFRREVRRHVEATITDDEQDVMAYRFADLFKEHELTFLLSDAAPPELERRAALDYLVTDSRAREFGAIWERAEELARNALQDDTLLSRLIHGPQHRFELVTTNLLGGYDASTSTVIVYMKMTDWAARVLAVDTQALANVVFMQQCVHAVSHLGRDLDGRMWNEFALPSSRDINFRPSLLHEGIANYFSRRLVERLSDAVLSRALERLSECQPAEIQAGNNRLVGAPIEEVRKALLRARASLDQFWWTDR